MGQSHLTEGEERKLLAEVLWPSHEPLAFMRRKGGVRRDYAEYYERYHRPENVEKWARLLGPGGMVILHFFKGLGLEAEREEIERTTVVARKMHELGMRVSLYVGGTMHTETFYREVPEARRWEAVSGEGGPITYMFHQLWRHFPCINNPDYRAYVRKVLDVAIDQVGADNIHFDNQVLRAEPQSCRCSVCRQLFPRYVEAKYTPAQRVERFGYDDVSGLEPPAWSGRWPPQKLTRISDPAIQEWIDFRCHSVHDFLTTMQQYVTARKPTCTVSINIKGLHPRNDCFDCGIDHGRWRERFVNTCDAGVRSGVGPRGNLIAEFRAFKASHTTGLAALDDGDERGLWLSAVMTRGIDVPGVGCVPNMGQMRVFGPLGRFLRRYEQQLYGTRPIFADVAVLRSYPSMAYNTANWCYGPYIAEQGLWEAHVPFAIIFDQNLDELASYRALLLANQESLSDAAMQRIRAFVAGGGGLVATEDTGAFDDWRRPRPRNALVEAFGLEVGHKLVRVRLGKGRVAYIPRLEPACAYEDDMDRYAYGNPETALAPRNWAQVQRELRWAAGGAFTFEVRGPRGLAVEYRQGPAVGDRAVHLMNLRDKPIPGPIRVTMKAAGARWTLRVLSPDPLPRRAPALAHRGGRVSFTVAGVTRYAVCVLRPGVG